MKDIEIRDKTRVLARFVIKLHEEVAENFKTRAEKLAGEISSRACEVILPTEVKPIVILKGKNGIQYQKQEYSHILSNDDYSYLLHPGLSADDRHSSIRIQKMPNNSDISVEGKVVSFLESIIHENRELVNYFLFKNKDYLKTDYFGKDLSNGLIKHEILQKVFGDDPEFIRNRLMMLL